MEFFMTNFNSWRSDQIKQQKELYKLLHKGKYTTCKFLCCGKKTEKYRYYCKEHRSNCCLCGEEMDIQINGKEYCNLCLITESIR